MGESSKFFQARMGVQVSKFKLEIEERIDQTNYKVMLTGTIMNLPSDLEKGHFSQE